jgi:glyoxylase-like metal-dependent hydrolase (beta-lactamase superfamily II)
MREVATGVWHWEAPHPEWNERQDWPRKVSSYAIADDRRLLVFDPLAVPAEIDELAVDRETAIVLTCPYHRRDAIGLAERLGVPIYVPPPDPPDPDPVPGQVFEAGDRLPIGVDAHPGREPNDLVLWVESARALVVGDTLIDRGDGLEFPRAWVPDDMDPDAIFAALQPLRELPVEHVLATHGGPYDRAALERALA